MICISRRTRASRGLFCSDITAFELHLAACRFDQTQGHDPCLICRSTDSPRSQGLASENVERNAIKARGLALVSRKVFHE